jgi:hypothetical protein
MGKLSWEQKEEIIKRDLPGYRIVPPASEESADVSSAGLQSKPEAGTPEIRELRRKYFGIADELSNGPDTAADAVADEDELVRVELENKPDDLDRGSRVKSVVISGGEVKGSQG